MQWPLQSEDLPHNVIKKNKLLLLIHYHLHHQNYELYEWTSSDIMLRTVAVQLKT